MWQSLENLKIFNALTLKQVLWKTKTFFVKLEYRFLVKSTTAESVTSPNKLPSHILEKKGSICLERKGHIFFIFKEKKTFFTFSMSTFF